MRIEPVVHEQIMAQFLHQDTSKDHDLCVIFPPSEQAVRKALASTIVRLKDMDLDADEIGTAELVLAEVLNNVVEHAFADGQEGMIELQVACKESGLWCSVLDDGAPMPDGQHPVGVQADLDCEMQDLPEGGFGWFLIGELTHDLTYERTEDGNHLQFRLNIGKPMLSN